MWLFPLQLVGIHVGVEGLQIHGRGEEIALSVLAVRGKELLQLVFGLHSLAEDLDAEAAGHVHERGNDDPDRALLFLPGGQEGPVQLDGVEAEGMQHGHGGIALAEVVEAQADARTAQGIKGADEGFFIQPGHAFRDLHMQQVGGNIVAGRDAEDGLDIVVVEEQGLGLVDADGGHLFAFVQAAAYPGADRIQDKEVQFADEAVLLEQGMNSSG